MPSQTYGAERDACEAKRLAQESKLWSTGEKAALIEAEAKLEEWQQSSDSPEALATLPCLTLEDLKEEPEYLETKLIETDKLRVLSHPSPTEGIVYVKLYFDISDAEYKDLPRINFLSELMGRLGTSKRDAEEIQREVKDAYWRSLLSLMPVPDYDNSARCKLYYVVTCSVLENELSYSIDLIREIVRRQSLMMLIARMPICCKSAKSCVKPRIRVRMLSELCGLRDIIQQRQRQLKRLPAFLPSSGLRISFQTLTPNGDNFSAGRKISNNRISAANG